MTDILGKSPEKYYNKNRADKYNLSGAFKRIQRKMTMHALRIAGWEEGEVLDIGCGTGFSTQVLKQAGFEVTGCDINENMLEHAESKGLKVVRCDMKNLGFKDESFDYAVSISTVQWAEPSDYKKILQEINRVIRKEAIIQFYPETDVEFQYFYSQAKNLFHTNLVRVGEAKKKKLYIMLKKRK